MDENIRELFAAIDIYHANEMTIPTAALIYVAIDTLGWMAYGGSENSSKKDSSNGAENILEISLTKAARKLSFIVLAAQRSIVFHQSQAFPSQGRRAKYCTYQVRRILTPRSSPKGSVKSVQHAYRLIR